MKRNHTKKKKKKFKIYLVSNSTLYGMPSLSLVFIED